MARLQSFSSEFASVEEDPEEELIGGNSNARDEGALGNLGGISNLLEEGFCAPLRLGKDTENTASGNISSSEETVVGVSGRFLAVLIDCERAFRELDSGVESDRGLVREDDGSGIFGGLSAVCVRRPLLRPYLDVLPFAVGDASSSSSECVSCPAKLALALLAALRGGSTLLTRGLSCIVETIVYERRAEGGDMMNARFWRH